MFTTLPLWRRIAAAVLFFYSIFLAVTAKGADAGQLQAGDSVDIRIFRHEELSGRFIVGADGAVSLQFINKVNLAGLSPTAASQRIEGLYRDGWLRRPQVTVNIVEFARTSITVTGEVNHGGAFAVARNKPVSVISAIGMAGGFTNRANQKAVLLKRGGKTWKLNYKDILADPRKDVILADGDVVYVQLSSI